MTEMETVEFDSAVRRLRAELASSVASKNEYFKLAAQYATELNAMAEEKERWRAECLTAQVELSKVREALGGAVRACEEMRLALRILEGGLA